MKTMQHRIWTVAVSTTCALALALGTATSAHAQRNKKPKKDQTQTMDSLSYALGVLFATNLSNEGLKQVDGDALKTGFEASLAGESAMSADEANAIVQSQMAQIKEQMALVTKQEGEDFLAENCKKDGIQTTESGLQYRHEVVGTGVAPDSNDEVTVHYRGTLLNGEEFDSSYKRGEPISFPLNGVIRGWTEGLQLMQEGGKTTFYIPQELAYGARPAPGGAIPPNAALVFEVELIKVNAKP